MSQGCQKCGYMGWLVYDVEVKHPDFGKAHPCECVSRQTAGFMQGTVGKGWALDTFPGDKQAHEQARRAFESGRGIWVFWSRQFGTGKTGLLIGVVNECRANGRSALYESVPKMLDELRASYKDNSYMDIMHSLMEVPVLALDEFHRYYEKAHGDASEGSASWAAEKIFEIIEERYLHWDSLLTLVATNRKPDKGDLDPISSRFGDSLRSHIIAVGGGDLRPMADVIETVDFDGEAIR